MKVNDVIENNLLINIQIQIRIFGYTNKCFCVKIFGIEQNPFAYYLNVEGGVFF